MDNPSELSSMSQSFLCFRCGEETELFFQRKPQDPRYCFELFRRAVVLKDELAWECIYHRFLRLVTGWVERHPLYHAVEEDSDLLVNWSFEKMWAVMTPEKFTNFPDLKSLLRYLQMCVHSVITDVMRAREKTQRIEEREDQDERRADLVAGEVNLEEQVFQQFEASELWKMIKERLKNEKEQRVLYGMFVLALKPAELYELYPGTFQNVREVYGIKDNLLERLRRDSALRAMFQAS